MRCFLEQPRRTERLAAAVLAVSRGTYVVAVSAVTTTLVEEVARLAPRVLTMKSVGGGPGSHAMR